MKSDTDSLSSATTSSPTWVERVVETREVLTESECAARVAALTQEGWTALPCDDPTQGAKGYLAYRYIAEDTKEPVTQDPVRCVWLRSDGTSFLDPTDKGSPETATLPRVRVLEEVRVLEYPLFGKLLTPDVQIVTPGLLAEMLKKDSNYKSCSDPKALLLGFVWYNADEGKAVVRQTRISSLRTAEAPVKDVIMAARDKLFPKACV